MAATSSVPMQAAPPKRSRRVLAWLIVSQLLAALSLLPWMLVAGLSVMAFDAPGSAEMLEPWLLVGTVWAYPLFPLTFSIAAWIAFALRRTRLAAILTSIPMLIVIPLLLLLLASISAPLFYPPAS